MNYWDIPNIFQQSSISEEIGSSLHFTPSNLQKFLDAQRAKNKKKIQNKTSTCSELTANQMGSNTKGQKCTTHTVSV